MTPKICSAQTNKDFTITLEYQNGQFRRFDMKPWLDKGIFCQLREPALFSAIYISFDTIAWPGNIDIDPETLYEDSVLLIQ